MTRAIDCLVNVDMGDIEPPEWMIRVKEDTFKAGKLLPAQPGARGAARRHGCQRRRASDPADEARQERQEHRPRPTLRARASGSILARRRRLQPPAADAGAAQPRNRSCATTRSRYAVVGPSFWGDGMYPPSDAVYYPLYTKCCELDLPLCVNTGIPGPPIPGEAQNPIHLDRVCVRFPELRLCMIHGADPWWDVAIRLMLKYRNLRLMTSAWSPKRLPPALLHYLATRGTDRILFASDYPVLSMQRCLDEARALDLTPEVRDAWLYGNAETFFFEVEPQRRQEHRRSNDEHPADRRGQPLLRAVGRLHAAPGQGLQATRRSPRAGRQARRAPHRRSGQPLRPQSDLQPDHRRGLPRRALPRQDSARA